MNKNDRAGWRTKTERMNQGQIIQVGDLVQVQLDTCQTGTVTQIETWPDEPPSVENHGSVTIQFPSGIEHFTYYGWQSTIRKLSEDTLI